MKRLGKAIAFAAAAHKDQLDQGGQPYILHCLEVLRMVGEATKDEDTLCAAVLHDVVEDCKIPEGLIKHEFGEEVASLVECLTKPDWVQTEEHYLAYVRAITVVSPKAALVKMMDIRHNSDIRRLKRKPLRDKDFARIIKYQKAHTILEEFFDKGA